MAIEKRLIDINVTIQNLESEIEQYPTANSKDMPFEALKKSVIPKLVRDVINYLEKQPTVDAVEVVHGRWIYEPVEFSIVKDIRCSVCRRYVKVPENYCPDCGAKMDGGSNG